MTEIQVIAHLNIKPGKIDEFKTLAHSCIEMVKQKDKGTLQYDWYFNENNTVCIVHERYINAEAGLQHIANLGELVVALFELCDMSFDIFGSPTQELKNALEGMNITYYEFAAGIN
ncbi:putative quinol monooxygenase [Fulvivirga sedimenti]|uniref:Antibiotic biosynthesis monooxygenase n=1 Tax=Fulvivirga sedimenti TaxID=2879465 RepID=A0A9X1HMZ2_9BACT|nr:antibiotic biosynthesis monooxygenase [Fulvivirga sedimenti]MCA6074895.1 antibiotic biosynthesis monooxygenase [Fulvivirga sedimenti]MCA6076072.1 antibiotic biosynthesis monooxygenase [Fulvivirga sedimenti]MCA6077200.1 antibiotic biosynthesis monooxygenase [Fulvivirga sedimenti]